jgi:Uma2 family endonuclease
MGLPATVLKFTPEEYYRQEESALYKSDFYRGKIYAMAGGSFRHSMIAMNLGALLHQVLKSKPCRPYDGNLRLGIPEATLRCYPDVSIYCGKPEADPTDKSGQTATNPTVLFEVLSPSTEAWDRGAKSAHFRRIPSLKAYVFIAQTHPRIELFERQEDGAWRLSEAIGMDGSLKLTCVDADLVATEIYDGVEFDPPETLNQPPPDEFGRNLV